MGTEKQGSNQHHQNKQKHGGKNSVPKATTGKKLRDMEDPVDIYDHTKEFFKAQSASADKVDIGERIIKGEIELDNIVYGG